jgi:hypothetical protein
MAHRARASLTDWKHCALCLFISSVTFLIGFAARAFTTFINSSADGEFAKE